MRREIELYIKDGQGTYHRMDVNEDQSIVVKQSVKDMKDPGKLFT